MGILDMFNSGDPAQQQGLLAAAAQMLQASGPSLMPHSFGQVAGAGVAGFQAGKQQAMQQQREQLQSDLLAAQVKQALVKGNLVNQFLANMQPGRQQGQPQQSGQGMPPVIPMGGTDSDGRTISTPGFFAPADFAPQSSSAPAASGGASMNVPNDAIAWSLAGFPDVGKMVNERTMPTELVKTASQLGIPLSTVRDSQLADMNSKGITAVRPGGTLFKNGAPIFSAPTTDGQYTTWDNGVPSSQLVPGAADTNTRLEFSRNKGKAMLKPMAAVDPTTGKPVYTSEYQAATGGVDPYQQITWNLPEPSADMLQKMRTLAATGNKDAQLYLQGYDQHKQAQQGQQGAVVPAMPAGYNESQQTLATAGAKRYTNLIDQAADSPTRVNVYDNILNLSRNGVATGPGQDWKNAFKGYVANTPGLSSVAGAWKDDVAGFQELKKFMYQNAMRNWQAAGGTGTDAQLEASFKMNPNDNMFPQALQKMAEWGKAGELALQGKTNAMQQWKDANNGNVANQDQFERTWRNNFDPVLFQLKTMDPQEAATYVANLKKSNPNAYSNLMMKAQALKNIGGL